MSIPQSFVLELLAKVDVVDIVGRYVKLKRAGANFSGLCPFHNEKSPSFTVSPSKQFYHCFGCGKNGNAIGFLMEHTGLGFVEAVHELAQQFGMAVPEDQRSAQERAQSQQQRAQQTTLTDVLEKAAKSYQRQLKTSTEAIAYLKGRGLSGQVAKQFGLGYAPAGWRHLASVFPHYDDPLLVDCGLVITQPETDEQTKRYDRFRDRVMFPIRNVKGECIGFGGRVLGDEKPKYLNSPETPVFSKGHELYGLFEARSAIREAGYVLVTEGYMDVVALAQLNMPNAVATLGTACTTEHVHKLFRFSDAVIFSFDGDAAGRRAARKALDAAIPMATDLRSVKFLFLPPEHDPDSFIRAHGKEAFTRYVSEATPLSRFLVDAAREGCDLHTAEGRAHMASQARPLWENLPEGALKQQLLGELADAVQLSSRELLGVWRLHTKAGKRPSMRTAITTKHEGQSFDPVQSAGQPDQKYITFNSAIRISEKGYSAKSIKKRPDRPYPSAPTAPNARPNHAARIVLGQMSTWGMLTPDDHRLLCNLPAPHGALFSWLDRQWHELGELPWVALREGLQGHEALQLALSVMSLSDSESTGTNATDIHPKENLQELRRLVNRMWIDELKVQETLAIETAKAQPQALQTYRDLQARRRLLENAALVAETTPAKPA